MLIPGIQGRWEYMRSTVDALSPHFDVRAISLDATARSLDDYVAQVSDALDRASIDRAVVCGVSFGGLVALRFAATQPSRTQALVLASTPGPDFALKPRHRFYARLPWIFGPLFLAETPWRLRREIAVALPDRAARRSFRLASIATFCRVGVSLPATATRARMFGRTDAAADAARVTAPTLVVTGERDLDYIVPADGSIAYAQLIPGARAVVLERTGHIGSVTRPQAFAALVHDFVEPIIVKPKLGTPNAAA
ncbi:MAG TPA: alpha/beta hydrolase [Vicinamibacterales bacterium]|nr:alpha/beta hydrolase [Vicinamibacterales bacterium]